MVKKQYLLRLLYAIEALHKCRAEWVETVPVTETFLGQTVWDGEVEIYNLEGHPKAKRCYGWAHAKGDGERFVTVLEIPPADSPQNAVKVAAASEAKQILES